MAHDATPRYSQARSILTAIFTRVFADDPDIRFEDFENRSIELLMSSQRRHWARSWDTITSLSARSYLKGVVFMIGVAAQ